MAAFSASATSNCQKLLCFEMGWMGWSGQGPDGTGRRGWKGKGWHEKGGDGMKTGEVRCGRLRGEGDGWGGRQRGGVGWDRMGRDGMEWKGKVGTMEWDGWLQRLLLLALR